VDFAKKSTSAEVRLIIDVNMNLHTEHSYKIKEVKIKNETYDKLLKIASFWGIPSKKIIEITIEAIVKELWDKGGNRPGDRRKLGD